MTLVLRCAARSDRGELRSTLGHGYWPGRRHGWACGRRVASQLVIAAWPHLGDGRPGGDLLAKLDAAVRRLARLSQRKRRWARSRKAWVPLTAILLRAAGSAWCISVTRAVTCCATMVTQITKDDTFVQTLVDGGSPGGRTATRSTR